MSENRIDPRACLIGDVHLGRSNVIDGGAVIIGPIAIGDGNYFGPNCVIGSPPQDDLLADGLRKHGLSTESEGRLSIGDRNVFREFTTVHRGLTGTTVVEDDSYVMAYANIQHDCHVGKGVKLANNVQMGGYSWIGRGVYAGLSATLHQFSVVGAHSMIGMGSVLTRRETPPGSLLYGNPARLVRPNSTALQRLGVTATDWWDAIAADEHDTQVPAQLQDDMREYQEACTRASADRVAVTAWRAAQHSLQVKD